MTQQLSDEDKEKMKEVFSETPEDAMRRESFWMNQPKPEFKVPENLKDKHNWDITITRWYCPFKFSTPKPPCARCKHPDLEKKGVGCAKGICPIIT